mmetsp:Transcript_22159/g.33809  ORF Transcript_22159/g.33809 Transcript_22159/m.33809 type:complete len:107 (+) Transcript_22159:64-384(+)
MNKRKFVRYQHAMKKYLIDYLAFQAQLHHENPKPRLLLLLHWINVIAPIHFVKTLFLMLMNHIFLDVLNVELYIVLNAKGILTKAKHAKKPNRKKIRAKQQKRIDL